MAAPAARLAGGQKAGRARRSTKAREATGTSEQIRRAKSDGDGQVTPEEIRQTEESFDTDVEKERTKHREAGAKGQRKEARQRARRQAFTSRAYDRVARAEVGGVSIDDGAGLLLGLMAWIVVLNYIRNGPDGVRALLRAKFLNQSPSKEPLP